MAPAIDIVEKGRAPRSVNMSTRCRPLLGRLRRVRVLVFAGSNDPTRWFRACARSVRFRFVTQHGNYACATWAGTRHMTFLFGAVLHTIAGRVKNVQ